MLKTMDEKINKGQTRLHIGITLMVTLLFQNFAFVLPRIHLPKGYTLINYLKFKLIPIYPSLKISSLVGLTLRIPRIMDEIINKSRIKLTKTKGVPICQMISLDFE
jgi:hypothetical protein